MVVAWLGQPLVWVRGRDVFSYLREELYPQLCTDERPSTSDYPRWVTTTDLILVGRPSRIPATATVQTAESRCGACGPRPLASADAGSLRRGLHANARNAEEVDRFVKGPEAFDERRVRRMALASSMGRRRTTATRPTGSTPTTAISALDPPRIVRVSGRVQRRAGKLRDTELHVHAATSNGWHRLRSQLHSQGREVLSSGDGVARPFARFGNTRIRPCPRRLGGRTVPRHDRQTEVRASPTRLGTADQPGDVGQSGRVLHLPAVQARTG